MGSHSTAADYWLWFHENGLAKLSKGPDAFAAILHALSVPGHTSSHGSPYWPNCSGNLAILLSAFVPLVSLPLAALLFVAILTVHIPYGFSSIKLMSVVFGRARFGPPGYEYDLLYLACLAGLVLGGSGPMVIDDYLS